jgi:hypothetical protein
MRIDGHSADRVENAILDLLSGVFGVGMTGRVAKRVCAGLMMMIMRRDCCGPRSRRRAAGMTGCRMLRGMIA